MVISRLLVALLSLLCASGVLAEAAYAGQVPQETKESQKVQGTQPADNLEVAVEPTL